MTRSRGQVLDGPEGSAVVATVHPSSVLRAPDAEARQAQRAAFVQDLRRAADLLDGPAG